MQCCLFVLRFLFILVLTAFSVNIMAQGGTKTANIFFNSDAAEPSTDGLFTITFSAQPVANISVFYRVSGGTATEGSDFADFGSFGQSGDAGRVEFSGGPLSIQVPLVVIDDLLSEGDETVIIEISGISTDGINGESIAIGPNNQISVTIEDNDGTGTFTVSKNFLDDNSASVQVTLSCTSATIDQTTKTASEGNPAVFNLTNISVQGVPNFCSASEIVPPGYSGNDSACLRVLTSPGSNPGCTIVNTPHTATITVNKNFVDNNPASVQVTLTCSDAIIDQATKAASEGSPAVFSLTRVDFDNVCTATESVPNGYTADQSGCTNLGDSGDQDFLGGVESNSKAGGKESHNVSDSCTITNTPKPATFTVNKNFSDNSEMEVQVTLVCTRASIDQPTRTAAEGNPAVFNLTNVSFDNQCTATEIVPDGFTVDESGCAGRSAGPGSAPACTIVNTPIIKEFRVFKDFLDDSDAEVLVTLTCTDATIDQGTRPASPGKPAKFNLSDIGANNECTATETVPQGYEADESDCVGVGAEVDKVGVPFCTIVNAPVSGGTTFTVQKDFTDDSMAEVQVNLSCTEATIDQASKPASQTNAAVFNLSDVAADNVCTATETVPQGYSADESDCAAKTAGPDSSNSCVITNTPVSGSATFTVQKDFSDDNTAEVMVTLVCTDASIDQATRPASQTSAAVFNLSDVAADNVCTATETVPQGYTADESDCAGQAAGPESSANCMIINTFVEPPPGTTFTVQKDFSDDSTAEVQINLVCTSASIDTASKLASEASPAVFNLSEVVEGNSCTATETVPEGYTPDENDCVAVAAPQGSSNSCTITNTLPGKPDNPFPESFDPNQVEIGGVIFETCITNPPVGGNEKDFQALCSGLVGSAFSPDVSDAEVEAALKQATPDDAAAVRSSGMQTTNVQVAAVGGRLGTLRGGGGAGFSASGFSMNIGDLALNSNLIQSFVSAFDQNNPAFMQANVGQNDDGGLLEEFGRWGIWISGRVIFGDKDLSTNQIDYDFDTAGLTFGLDYRFTEQFVAGIAVGYANTDADLGADGGEIDTDGYSVSLYGTWFQSDRFYLAGSLGYGSNDYEQLRKVRYDLPGSNTATAIFKVDQTLAADYDGTQYNASISGGWDFNHDGWTYGPTFRINYVDVDVDSYDEKLIDSNIPSDLATVGWAVQIDDQSYESLQTAIGFEFSKAVSRSWGVFIPQGFIEIVSELEDGGALVTGRFLGDLNQKGTFTLLTDDFEETFARAGLGFGLILKNNKSAFLMVDSDLGRDLLQTYYVNAGFRWQF